MRMVRRHWQLRWRSALEAEQSARRLLREIRLRTDASKPDKSKKVCKTIVTTGTRFSTRHCRSKEDWDKDAEASRRYLEEGQTYGYARDGTGTAENGSGVTPPR